MRRHMASPCRSVSYHPVPQTSTEFPNFRIDQPQDWKYYKRICGGVSSVEAKDREFTEEYRPLRQRTARKETTNDTAGALPPAVYTKQQDSAKLDLLLILTWGIS